MSTDEQKTAEDQPEPEAVAADAIEAAAEEGDDQTLISEPSKLIRIASMTRAMLDEVREANLDEPGRRRLVAIHQKSIGELRDVVSDDLKDELDAIFHPLSAEAPSDSELRVAQAQLVGWLEGLFHGIQASLFSQQLTAQAQLEEMRRRRALEANQEQGDNTPGLYL
ncbi:MAG: DUF2587 domain-containing protein [Acidimicrobiia bacterium]|nr:DUF2587 domain-containing protein [Acidimicrobiia bacterium]